MKTAKPWWQTDQYAVDNAVPQVFHDLAGPAGLALVKAYEDGRTAPGWGLQGAKTKKLDEDGNPVRKPGFMPRYMRDEFIAEKALFTYERGTTAFAFVMRSVQIICIDIDGKNGGLEHAKRLGPLPPTLAETSKSGNGYHLFYLVPESWDVDEGFGMLHDHIGIEQGVDIRATGCVYHWPSQRWNGREIAELPEFMSDMLLSKIQRRQHDATRITEVVDSEDEMEILMMHAELIADLKKPIAAGKRNNTLFAIGSKMKVANLPEWDQLIADRANEVGLDADESAKLVENIAAYN